MGVRPEDVLPNDINAAEINGVNIRKGTVAAAIANAKILAMSTSTHIEKSAAENMLKQLAPALVALELHQHLTWKNPIIQKIIDEAIRVKTTI